MKSFRKTTEPGVFVPIMGATKTLQAILFAFFFLCFINIQQAQSVWYIGPLDPSIGTSSTANYTNYYVTFDVLASTGVRIDALDIYPAVPGGTYTIVIEDAALNVLGSWTGTSTVASGQPQRIPFNTFVPMGTNYRFRPTLNPNLYRNTTGANYPYTVPGVMSITGHNFSGYPQYHYYFYNIGISPAITYAADAGVTAITSPVSPLVPGSANVIVSIKNFGTNNLTTATIGWSLNGVQQGTVPWNGNLAPDAIQTGIQVANHNFPQGLHELKVWTSMPNGVADSNHFNDTATMQLMVCNSLNGVYTIGAGGNFANINQALDALQSCGLTGPVTFNVLPGAGPFVGGFEIGAIAGVNATNTVTFNGNGAVINESTATYILGFNGATYITFNNFQIINTDPTTGKFGILIRGNSQYLNITNNIIDAGMGTTSSTAAGIVVSNSTTSATTAGTNGQYLTISNNEIIGGYYGITLMGSASYLNCVGNIVADNIIRDFHYYGIYMSNTENNIISGNELKRMVRTSFSSTTYGLYMTTTRGSKVIGNQIHSCGSGSYTMYSTYITGSENTAGNESEFINNAIYNFPTSGTVYGLYFLGTRNYVNVYHNTVHLDVQLAGTKYACYFSGAPNNHNVKNNIFSIKGPGTGTKYCIYVGTTSTSFISDYNNLYMGGTGGTANHVGYWPSAARTTLANWQTATGQDANSLNVDPTFPAMDDIKTKSIALWQAGTPIAGVTTDIFGTARNTTAPCIGAYEYMLYTRDAGVTQMLEPGQACPGIQPVKVKIKNHGTQSFTNATIQWRVNGVLQTPGSYTGTLAPGAEAEVTIGSYNFLHNVLYNIVFNTLNPGGLADLNPVNDTLKVMGYRTGLNGVYSVGTGGSYSFTSIETAIQTLYDFGVCGPVTINVAAGTGPFVGGFELGPIPGASATNTVTFNGNGNVVNESAATFILGFNGAAHITVNNFQFVNTVPSTAKFGILVRGASQYLTFTNNIIDVGTTSTSPSSAGIVVSNSPLATSAGNNGQYLTIDNNEIVGGYYGITLIGNASYLDCVGNIVTNNIIRDFYQYGIYLNNNEGTMVSGNNIHRENRSGLTTFYGIYMATSRNVKIAKNQVHSPGIGTYSAYPFYIATASVNTAGNETEFINNAIFNITTTGTVYGFYFLGTRDYINVYHNTVHLIAEGATDKRAFFASTAPNNHKLINNNFSIQGVGTGTKHLIYVTGTSTTYYGNYNNLYMGSTAGTNHTGFWVANQTTLADWQLATGQDFNSQALDPVFPGPTNITPVKYQLDNKGTPLAGITTDIYGTTRSATMPDIGAVEFVAPDNPIMTLSTTSYNFGLVEVGTTTTFQLTITNSGPKPLIILGKSVSAPFSIVTTPATGFITIVPGGSTVATVRYIPTAPGEHAATLQFNANTTVISLSVQLQGRAYGQGLLFEDFEGPNFPPNGWTLVQGPCSPSNDIIRSTDASVSPNNSLRFNSYNYCASGYQQYAILPRVVTDASNRTISFWYSKADAYNEIIRVGWSSTGTDISSDFTWSSDITMASEDVWYFYEKTDLPIGTKYIAIHYNPLNSYYSYVYIDDIIAPKRFPILLSKVSNDQLVVVNNTYNYKVAVKNNGSTADVYNLSSGSAKGFSYTIRNKQDNANISSISLAPGAQDTVILKVSVSPAGITSGDTDNGYLKFVSQSNATLSDSVTFTTTAIVPFTPPYMQPFTTFADGPYEYWTEAKGVIGNPTTFTDPNASYWAGKNFGNNSNHLFGKGASINVYYTGMYEWLMSPIFNLGAKSIYNLEFDIALTTYGATTAASLAATDTIALVVSTDGGLTWNKSNIIKVWNSTTPISNTGERVVLSLAPYSGYVKFAFYVSKPVTGGDIDFFVDNFSILNPNIPPDCLAGGMPADSTLDLDPALQLTWLANPNTAGYKVYFGTTNPPPFVANVGNALSYTPGPGTTNYGSTYYWKVVPYNAGGDATGCPVWTFKTLTPLTIPYMQDFNTMTGGTPPQFWSEGVGLINNPTVLTSKNSTYWTNKTYGNNAGHPNGTSASINLYTTSQNDWLFTPLFDLGTATQIFVEFDLAMTYWNTTNPATMDGDDTLALVISTDGGATWNKSNIVALWTSANPASPTGNAISIPLTGYSGVVKFGFYGQSKTNTTGVDFDVFIDNFALLSNGILGKITYDNPNNTPLQGVDVQIPAQGKTTVTDAGGLFTFMPLANGSYNLTANSTQPVGGINTSDALLAVRHFVGLDVLTGLPALAANVNGDGGINAADALEIQKFYLRMVNSFAAGPWQFTTATATVAGNVPLVQIRGLATGDVNASYVIASKAESHVAVFEAGELVVPSNRSVQIPIYAAQTMEIGAISLTLNYPASRLRIDNITTNYPAQNLMWRTDNGQLIISWYELSGQSMPAGSEMFTIHAVATSGAERISLEGNHGEFATALGQVIENAAISIPKLITTFASEGLILSSYPNPTSGMCTFTYEVSEAGKVSLKLYNAMGQQVADLVNAKQEAGVYQISYDASQLPAGVYISKLDLNGQSASMRVVITD